MKTIYNIINRSLLAASISCMALGAVSCDDMLDTKPQGVFTADQMDDAAVEGLMSAAYAGLQSHFFGNNEAFAGPITNWIFDVRSDDAYKGGGGTSMEENIHQLEMSNIQSDNVSVFNKWENNVFAISRCNKAILAVQDAPAIGDKENLIAQLKTLRAYFYFDMIRIYENIPYWTETEDANSASPYQYTRDEIFSFIKKDLADAYKVLPETQSQVGRFNKYAAAAIHAKVSAFTSSWSEVEEYAGYIIDSKKYQLYPNFLDMSKIEYNNMYESLVTIQFSTANNNANINWCNLLNTTYSDGNLFGNGDDFFLASQNLVNAFRTDSNGLPYLDGTFNDVEVTSNYDGNVDPRLDFTVGRLGFPFRGHIYNMKWCRAYDVYGEYSGKKGLIDPSSPDMVQGFPWGASPLSFKLIRYADIILLKAEALIEQGKDLDTARILINSVRRRAANSVDPNYTPIDCDPSIASYYVAEYPSQGWNQDYARRAVRMERRLELAMEGHRWFDLVRWGVAVETMNQYYRTEQRLRSYYETASMSADELYFPIPLSQVEISGGLYDKK